MQIVIDINENLYTRLFDNGVDNYDDAIDMAKAIRKGTPLPKGHGRIVDISKLEYLKALHDAKYGKIPWSEAIERIKNSAPTIIETDKESEEISDTNMKMWEEIFKAESEDEG